MVTVVAIAARHTVRISLGKKAFLASVLVVIINRKSALCLR